MKWGAIMEKKYYELTAPQKSIWLTEQYYKNTNINNVCGTFYSDEILDFEILKKALNTFLQSNDSFRIKLHFTEDKVVQYFSDLENIDFKIIDIKNKNEQSTLEENIASKVFTMLDSLLFEIVLFRYPDNHGGFVINSHHLISDSWTNGIVANDVALIYSKIKNNESYEKDKSLSYIEYIDSEKKYIESNKFQKDKEYWNNLFSTIPEVATIPSLKDSIKDDAITANRILLDIGTELFAKLKNYCSENKVSLYNFFMSVFALYLGRVSNLDEFVIGTPILNRTNYKEKETTGMFINTLPLKVTLSHEKTFLDNLKDIAVNSMSLLRHQKYSFQYLIEDLRKKDSNLPKLYNVLYSYQITKMNDNMDSLSHITSWAFNKTISDDLDIHMFEWNDNDSIQIAYDYRTSRYDEQDISDLHARILHVINQILENNNILLKDIEIVTPEEKHQILFDFNNTKSDYPKDKTIVDLFEEQVEKTPDNIAVVFADQKLTYRELNEKANQLARYLLEKGIKKGDIVGLFLNKSLEVIIAMFAILKSGAAFLPLDTEYPDERLNYILSNSSCKLILKSNKIENNIICNYYNINIDLDNTDIYSQDNNNISLPLSVDDIMYIMYTSGSTGKPKGVMVKHKNIIRLAKYPNFLSFENNENMVQTGTIVFDACIFEIFGALLNGFKTYILDKNNLLNINYFSEFLKTNNITTLFLTTGLFNEFGMQSPKMFAHLKNLLTGGDVISASSVRNIKNNCPNINIINCYGPTENGSYSTCYKITNNNSNIPIGKPITNSTAYIVSNSGSLCPIGVPGELWVGGDGVAKGYLNNSDLTKEKFISNPFGAGTIYKTGDLVKWLPDGNIEFIGRIDNQIKLRGFRIELNEIDNTILTYPNIKQSVSIIQNINNNKTICSYIVSDKSIDITCLKKYLSKILANYMIPSHIISLDKLPLNINGKVDRKSLPLPRIDARNIIKPRNEIDSMIIICLKKILDLSNISITSSFFDIGMDSLSSISLANTINSNLNLNITVKDIFNYPVISDFSDYICTLTSKTKFDNTFSSVSASFYHLSSAQKRVYYSWLRDKNSLLYNIAGGIIIEGNIDKSKLENCFKTLIERHSSLRTYFEQKDDNIVQIIKDKVDFKLDYEISDETDVYSIYRNFVKPFDLSKAPLFRTQLVKLDNKKSLLLLDMHHIISDGTSLNILLQELCDLYNGETLSTKELEYKDFTVWEQSQMTTDNFKEQKEYWINQFKDEIPLLNMPTSYPRPSVQNFEGSNYHAKLSKEQFSKINLLAQKLGITPYMLMLSVYYILLSKYTSQDDIVVGTPIVGRDMPELTNMLGMFVNTLALRNSVDHSISFKDFSKQIKENCLNSFKNQTYPFDMLVNDLNIKRDTSRNPLFDVMFVFQNNGYPDIHINGMKSEYYIPDNNISKFDLTLEIVPVDNEYSLRFEYCTKLFEEDFIKRLSSHYINILNAILENEELKIADIDMLSKEERKQILYDFNNIKENINSDTFVSLFEKQVTIHPDNIALICDGKSLTYDQLNEKANSLAHFLLNNGIKPNDIVAIMTNRSFETIVSMLGILKAGAAFVNMDPTYPIDRTIYYLEDSNAKCILKQKDISLPINSSAKVYDIDLSNKEIYSINKSNPNTKIELNTLSYIIYTSGSTGTPKGVVLNHLGLANMCKAMTLVLEYLKDASNHTLLSVTSTPFDIFVYEIVVPLSHGMKIVLANNSEHRNPKLVDKLIRDYNVDVMTVTPSLMKINYDNREPNSALANVKNMVFGGEPLPEKFIKDLKALSNDITIYNIYGPSEITVLSNVQNLEHETCINVGPPILNTDIYVLDSDMNPLPVGLPGEIYIGGVQVGNGYLGKEDLTNQKFINNPFAKGKMFKSGDIGKWTYDGKLQCLGRLDHQVKLRGLRIELGEIENILESIPQIDSAIVNKVIIDNKEALCAYYVANSKINEKDIRSILRESLPYYMVPSYFMKLDKMPYTINRKIDRKSLPIPNIQDIIKTEVNINSLSDTSQKLLQIWKDVLKVSDITVDDDFFDIGGDSISAIKMQIECVKYGINIEYSDIFKYPTIRLLSDLVKKPICLDIGFSNDDNIKTLLERNTLSSLSSIHKANINNILIIGTTGYLGIHTIYEFLKTHSGNAYCLIRPKDGLDPQSRFINTFKFYFGESAYKKYKNRIIIVKGDITIDNLGLSQNDINEIYKNVDIIINSGALVKHYGTDSLFESINVLGTSNVVKFCQKFNIRLIHISTISVSGNGEIGIEQKELLKSSFSESDLYIGQTVSGIYTYTKLKAEYIVLKAINSGLNGMILRIGNITNRFEDGMFQKNYNDNAFAKRLKSFIEIGAFPDYFLGHELELTPVDICAKAIISAINYESNCNLLHIYNDNLLSIKLLLRTLTDLGIKLIPVPKLMMSDIITGILQDDSRKEILSGIIYDLDKNKNLVYTSNISLESKFSNKYLAQTGFHWNKITETYLKKCFNYFNNINFINF